MLKNVSNTLQSRPYIDHRLSSGSTQSKRTSTDSTMSNMDYYVQGRPAPIYQTNSSQEEYWAFLKSVPDIQNDSLPLPSRCPSLISGATLSSRNSSTRSTRSSMQECFDDRNGTRRSVCIIPEENSDISYKGIVIDFPTHLASLSTPVVERCPVKTCERHENGFLKIGEGKKHAFTHFKGSLVCGFCKPYKTTFFRAPDRVSLFLTHLIKNHGVRGHQHDHDIGGARLVRKKSTGPVADCSICSEPFTAQVLYEHLPGCILRKVSRNDQADDQESQDDSSHEPDHVNTLSRSPHVKHRTVRPNMNKPQDIAPKRERELSPMEEPEEEECQEIVELTASSRCLSLTSSKAIESSEEETDWTEDVTSRESSPGVSQLPRRLSPAKRRAVDAIMQEFQRLFNQSIRSHTTGESSSGSSYNGSGGWSSNTSIYSNASFVSRKRSLSGGGSTPPNDEDDSNKRRRVPGSKAAGKQAVLEQRFACPYYKRNPGRHTTFTSCRDPGFTTVARLK